MTTAERKAPHGANRLLRDGGAGAGRLSLHGRGGSRPRSCPTERRSALACGAGAPHPARVGVLLQPGRGRGLYRALEGSYVTYPRTDCRYIPEGHHAEAQAVLDSISSACPTVVGFQESLDVARRSGAWDNIWSSGR